MRATGPILSLRDGSARERKSRIVKVMGSDSERALHYLYKNYYFAVIKCTGGFAK